MSDYAVPSFRYILDVLFWSVTRKLNEVIYIDSTSEDVTFDSLRVASDRVRGKSYSTVGGETHCRVRGGQWGNQNGKTERS